MHYDVCAIEWHPSSITFSYTSIYTLNHIKHNFMNKSGSRDFSFGKNFIPDPRYHMVLQVKAETSASTQLLGWQELTPQKMSRCPQNWLEDDIFSFWNGPLLGDMLIFREIRDLRINCTIWQFSSLFFGWGGVCSNEETKSNALHIFLKILTHVMSVFTVCWGYSSHSIWSWTFQIIE